MDNKEMMDWIWNEGIDNGQLFPIKGNAGIFAEPHIRALTKAHPKGQEFADKMRKIWADCNEAMMLLAEIDNDLAEGKE